MENKTYPRVQIIINADSSEDIQESIGWLNGTVQQSAAKSPATNAVKTKPAKVKAPDTSTTDASTEKTEAKTPEKPKEKADSKKSDAVSLDDLRKKMSAVLKSGKRDEAKALLAEFEAPKLGELSEDKYSDFNKRLDALLGGD